MVKINKELLPIKAHYFLFNAGTAPLFPYVPTLAKQLGIPSSGVGIMYTVFPFVGLIAKPSFGALADKFNWGKPIFLSAIALTAVFFSLICFIPPNTPEVFMSLDCDSMSYIRACDIKDNCTLTKLELENPDQNPIQCKFQCSNPDDAFLDQMCRNWGIQEACQSNNLTSFQLTTFSNATAAVYEQDCLSFPVNTVQFNDTEQIVTNPYCDKPSSVNCSVVCNSTTVMTSLQDVVIESMAVPYGQTLQYQLLFGYMTGAWATQAVVVSISDTTCFYLLGDNPNDYGKQRLWGAVGWGLLTIISGFLIDLASIGQTAKNYMPSFYLVVSILFINILAVARIKVEYRQEPNAFKKAATLFKNVRVVLFLFSCITFGMCIGLVWQFHLWFLEDLAAAQGCESLKWIKLLEGLAMGVQCFCGEAPFLFLSGWFLKKLGHIKTMTVILLAMGLRLVLYSLLVDPWWTLPIDLLNGLTLGLYWSTSASYADAVAPVGAAATLQGVFGAIFEGIGTSLGSLLGGFIFETYGGSVMFRYFGIYALAYGVVYYLIHVAMDYFGVAAHSALDGDNESKDLPNKEGSTDQSSGDSSITKEDQEKY